MLKHWTSHSEYISFVSDSVSNFNESQLKRWHSFSDSFEKLSSLNLDPLADHLAPYYSNTGRPAIHQPEIFRSFILMLDQHSLSLTSWTSALADDDILAILIGCSPDSLPPLGSYYDLINRLWLRKYSLDAADTKNVHPFPKNSKPKSAPGKNKKLPNKHPDIVKKVAAFIKDDRTFPFYFEELLQEIFSLLPAMALVFTVTAVPSVIKFVIAETRVFTTANAIASIPIMMLPLAGTATLVRGFTAILYICLARTTPNINLTFRFISVSPMPNAMTALPVLSLFQSFVKSTRL